MKFLGAIVLLALLAGCDKMEGQKVSEINPERKDYDFMKEQKSIKAEYELLDVPVLPGAKPVSDVLPMMKVNTDAGMMCSADWTTTMNPEKVIDFYRVELKESTVSKVSSGQTLVGQTKSGYDFTLSISPDPKDKDRYKFMINVIRTDSATTKKTP